MTSLALQLGPILFENPRMLWLLPIAGALVLWIARQNLSGLGTRTRWVALALRLFVVAMLAGALAEPQWRRESKGVAVTILLDVSDSVPTALQKFAERYIQDAVAAGPRQPDDRLGAVTIAREPYVQQLPTSSAIAVERGFTGKTDSTDISGAVRLALAVAPAETANKLVVVSDGNETVGSVLSAVAAAQTAGVPISILPLTYRYDNEVLMERLIVPSSARLGELVGIKVVLTATSPASGTLSLRDDEGPVDLDPDSPATGVRVDLAQGPNAFVFTIPVLNRGPNRFEAVFEPDASDGRTPGDTRTENNRQTAVTFASGEGSVLLIRENADEVAPFVRALKERGIPIQEVTSDQAPRDLVQMNAFDAIILANVPRMLFSEQQIADLQRYVRESGGGLVMLGGKNSLGAGIWMDSPLAEALPVDLNPPQRKEMPRGALGIWVHSVEMPDGRFLGQRVCNAGVDALTRLDVVGIAEWGPSGPSWAHPMSPLGDKSAIKRAINRLTFGDMVDWEPALTTLLAGMKDVQAGQKHCILISDGDPQRPSISLLQQFRQAGISISTVAIACHGIQDQTSMQWIAQTTGGRFYNIQPNAGGLAQVPQIFIKEAITVHRPLIREGDAFSPKISGVTADTFAGVTSVPQVRGYVRTADRGGLSVVTLKTDEDEPLMAQWQYGLGRSVVFASDVGGAWAPSWPSWNGYAAFWAQHVRWVMRPSNSAITVRITPESKGDETLLIVETTTREGERLSFVNFNGRLASPDGQEDQDIVLREIGPGRYEGRVRTAASGTYIASLRYRVPQGDGSPPIEGSASAAINRPFADEYRTLKDNVALLEQVRDKTGGVTLPRDPLKADLWNREGLSFPVAARPIWLLVSVLAISLFLADVAVRRVRIDLPAIVKRLRLSLRPAGSRQTELAGLKSVKDKARAGLEQRSLSRPQDSAAAAVKFEASADELRAASQGPAIDAPDAPAPQAQPSKPAAPKNSKQDTEEGMSALLKAKRRARGEIDDR
jgi:uncharacterized membrane protein